MTKIRNIGKGYLTYAVAICGLIFGAYQYIHGEDSTEIILAALGLVGLRRAIH